MTPAAVARALFEDGWNRQDFERVRPFLAPDVVLHVGGATRRTDAADLEAAVAAWHAAFADFGFEIHSVTADGAMVAVRATLHGTHTGPWAGLDATGRPVSVEHAFFLRFDGGVVAEVWEILDSAALHRQLAGS